MPIDNDKRRWRVGMSVPDGDGGFLAARKELRPCE